MTRILIAEDDATTRRVVGTMVKRMGHIPIYSPDGQHALETLRADEDIELLITDVMMPRMDGRELIRLIRADKFLAELPVIVMSAVVGPKEIFELLRNGATRFLPKPLSMDELSLNVAAALELAESLKEKAT
ncbi:response regulator [Desulfonatronum thioautotrophicum]|uniref:response regulator n=1 Tax=Desulfonatronum thioautotrophicum TaxID=617001 RepID=UPI0005EBEF91|nr:response regulator [Desulfonatronum thioautotrophicum]